MKKSIIIVESPGKIKKIQAFLGSNYVVQASRGHIMDLEKSSISVDISNNFEPSYTINSDKKDIVNNLKKLCKDCLTVYLAADEDREGEFIAESLKRVLKLKNYKRAVFHEITKKAIENAIENHKDIDYNMVYAQQARRILDRIVGYKLSPLLSKIDGIGANAYHLGAGRVQSVIVRIIVDKEKEIEDFLTSSRSAFYEGKGIFNIISSDFNIDLDTVLYTIDPIKKLELIKDNEEVYDKVILIANTLIGCTWQLVDIKKRVINRSPTAPFITSSLQQEASSRLHFPIAKTMLIAQKLYEDGLITYMRTDSTILSEEAHKNIKKFIIDNYEEKYYSYKQYKSKSANAQEAHEAIRPTDVSKTVIEVNEDDEMSNDKNKLYKLIWKKTVASQMAKAIIESNQLFLAPINSKKKVEKFLMVGSVSKVIFEGYLRVYKDLEEETVNINIPEDYSKLEIKMKTIKLKESLTSPPTRYNEASLVKKLEQLGIGRPSTYAAMISKIQKQDYVRVDNISGQEKILKELVIEDNNIKINDVKVFLGKENKKLVPTKIGILIVNFLIKHFPQIMDYQFTALLENDLDEISKGNKEWTNILRAFYEVLEKQILEFIKIAPINNVKNYVNNEIIGINNDQDIIYTKTKFGFAIKTFDTTLNKDLWVSVKTKPSLDEAINLFKTKQDNPIAASTLIKKIDKYQIKQGPYGPYIQLQIGKGVKFFKIFGKKPEELTLEDCKEICVDKKKTYKKTSKKIEI